MPSNQLLVPPSAPALLHAPISPWMTSFWYIFQTQPDPFPQWTPIPTAWNYPEWSFAFAALLIDCCSIPHMLLLGKSALRYRPQWSLHLCVPWKQMEQCDRCWSEWPQCASLLKGGEVAAKDKTYAAMASWEVLIEMELSSNGVKERSDEVKDVIIWRDVECGVFFPIGDFSEFFY